jgi:putative membrane protein
VTTVDPGATRGPSRDEEPDQDDRSAANERTALAWRRTVLAVVVGATLLTRLVLDRLGAAGLVAVAVGVPVGVWVFWSIGRPGRRSPGANAALTAAAVAVLAAVEVAALTFTGWSVDDAR